MHPLPSSQEATRNDFIKLQHKAYLYSFMHGSSKSAYFYVTIIDLIVHTYILTYLYYKHVSSIFHPDQTLLSPSALQSTYDRYLHRVLSNVLSILTSILMYEVAS